MDNIGDWLYIVLLAIAGISSILNSGKKKKEKNVAAPPVKEVTPEAENPSMKGFWEVFEEELKPKKVILPPKEKTIKSKQTQKASSPFLDTEKQILSVSGNKTNDPILLENIEDETSPIFKDTDLHDFEEMKRAILYSEILNRKY